MIESTLYIVLACVLPVITFLFAVKLNRSQHFEAHTSRGQLIAICACMTIPVVNVIFFACILICCWNELFEGNPIKQWLDETPFREDLK